MGLVSLGGALQTCCGSTAVDLEKTHTTAAMYIHYLIHINVKSKARTYFWKRQTFAAAPAKPGQLFLVFRAHLVREG